MKIKFFMATQTKRKYLYTKQQIMDKYEKLALYKKVVILSNALDIMQGNNSRSKADCVALAMGFMNDGTNRYYKTEDD